MRRRGRHVAAAVIRVPAIGSSDRYAASLDHEDLLVHRGRRSGVYCIVAVHSTVRGPALGGCRMWHYDDARFAIRDALRLSQAMTFKSAVAGLPLGGGKGVIMLREELTPERRADALRDFGETVEMLHGRYITAEDVGTSAPDMDVIATTTSHVSGLARERGGSGDPSPYTALGVVTAIEVTCERVFGSAGMRGRSVAISGLGNVGERVARRLADAGASLVVADIDERKRAIADELGARWVTPDEALTAPVDVLAPCALGGVLDHDSVPRLRCRAIAGAANNQLADDEVAALLRDGGILWAPDFVANAGGIINIAVEFEPGGYDPDRAETRVRGIADTLRTIFDEAEREGVTPLAAAMALAHRNLEPPA
jgi:leucine dehydrogenase